MIYQIAGAIMILLSAYMRHETGELTLSNMHLSISGLMLFIAGLILAEMREKR